MARHASCYVRAIYLELLTIAGANEDLHLQSAAAEEFFTRTGRLSVLEGRQRGTLKH